MNTIHEIWSYSLLDWITVGQLVIIIGAVVGGFLARTLSNSVLGRLESAAHHSSTKVDDIVLHALRPPLGWGLLFFGIYIALDILPLPTEPVDIARFVVAFSKGFISIMIVWFAIRLSDGLFGLWEARADKTATQMDNQLVLILRRASRVVIILIGGGLFLQNLGYSIGSLLAGLGIGGAALAFAAKDTLANLFGALTIFVDRPFAVGDWIEVGGVEGTVEEVRLRTSTVRTFANSLITLPNAQLTNSSINNWSRMQKRRIKMTVGVTYGTTPDQMQAAVDAIRQVIKDDPNILDDFYLVNFDNFGASSLDIFIYCFTRTTVWAEYLEAKQQFMLNVMRAVLGLGLSFAFPTQSLHIESMPEVGPAALNQPDRPL